MPDYGEIFCEAVETIANNGLTKLSYDYTQVCEIIDASKRNNGIYRVQVGQSKFQAYSSVTTYEVGDTVYVVTPNNDVSQQRIILAKKQTNVQEPITYVKPFNNFIKLTNNLVEPIYEKKLIANNKNQNKILIWSSSRDTVYAGYTRLGLASLFQSNVPEAIEGTYGLEICLYNGEDSKLIKTLQLSSNDMYGNPYNFNGYYTQQKLFDVSDLPAFDKIEIYFYQDNDFKDLTDSIISSKDNIGNLIAPNLFVSNPEIYLGYDTADKFNEGIILYTPNTIYYGNNIENKEIKWRFIKVYNDNTYKMITEYDKLPYGYKLNFYEYNPAAPFNSMAGANWTPIGTNIEAITFTPDKTVQNYKYKAIIVYNNRAIYESNILEFANTLDTIGEKINKYSNNFYIEIDDKKLNGEYYVYENGILSTKNNKRYAYPVFKNDKNEPEYISGVEQVKWVVPKDKTMIKLELPKDGKNILSIEDDLGNQSLEDYLDSYEKDGKKRNDFNYIQYKDNYYVYFYTPQDKEGQKISYTLKENLDTNLTNNTIKCYITHKDYNIETERKLSFGNSNMSPNPYKIELSFTDPEVEGFFVGEGSDTKKEIVANVYDTYGKKVKIKDNIEINWEWYEPDSEETYIILFNSEVVKDQKNNIVLDKINIYPINPLAMQSHHSIISAKLLIDNEVVAKAYFPIPLYKDKNVSVSNIVTEIQSGGNYNNIIDGEYIDKTKNEIRQLIASISSSFGEDIYKPEIINGIFTDNAAFIEDLKALYCYNFNDINELVAAIPALRINVPKKKNNELPIGTPDTNSIDGQTAYSLKAVNNVEEYYPYKVIKSDLSSGKLTENEGKSYYNGLIVGQVQQRITDADGIHSYNEPRYGIYGFQKDKMTFSVDEYGDAYFGGKLEGATGEFSGILNANEGKIGNWHINAEDGSLRDESGKIKLLPGIKQDGEEKIPGIWIGDFFFSEKTLIGDSLEISGVDVGESISKLRETDNTTNNNLKILDTELQAIEDIIYKESESKPKWENEQFIKSEDPPAWQEIEFISNITFENKKLTITKNKIKVLATSAPYGENSEEINME